MNISLGEVNTLEGRAAIQGDLGRLQEWASQNLMKFNNNSWNKFGRGQPRQSVVRAFALPAEAVELRLVHLGGGTDQRAVSQQLHRDGQGVDVRKRGSSHILR